MFANERFQKTVVKYSLFINADYLTWFLQLTPCKSIITFNVLSVFRRITYLK